MTPPKQNISLSHILALIAEANAPKSSGKSSRKHRIREPWHRTIWNAQLRFPTRAAAAAFIQQFPPSRHVTVRRIKSRVKIRAARRDIYNAVCKLAFDLGAQRR